MTANPGDIIYVLLEQRRVGTFVKAASANQVAIDVMHNAMEQESEAHGRPSVYFTARTRLI